MSGLKLGVLISGSGSNLQAIIDAMAHTISSKVVCVISNKEDAYGLERAKNHNIPTYVVTEKGEIGEQQIIEYLKQSEVDLVVLAGYLRIISTDLLEAYKGKIINIHPSLLPKYGGKGYYGLNVHKAVIENQEKFSGATVHYVEEGIDTGEIIMQKQLNVLEEDTPETLQQRILHEIEHPLIVEAIKFLESEKK